MLQPSPNLTATWPITADADPLLAIVQAQAETIEEQEALIHDYQGVLNAAQSVPSPATGSGTSTGTASVTVSAVTGVIKVGAIVTGTGVPGGTIVLGQQSGPTGGAGVYTLSLNTTLTNAALTFTPAATATGTSTGTTSLALSGTAQGPILLGSSVTGTGVPAGTVITDQQLGTPGGDGTYTTSVPTTLAAVLLTFVAGAVSMPWPLLQDADTLNMIQQAQSAVLKNQTALIQQYQDLLNVSGTSAPPTGP